MSKRIFMAYEQMRTYRKLTANEANSEPDNDECGTPTEVEDNNGVLTIRCLSYYSSTSVFELRITRPLDQAMQIYMAALRADGDIEGGLNV